MKIVQIERGVTVKTGVFITITFKTWWGSKRVEPCICLSNETCTIYAKNGAWIDTPLWEVIQAFVETKQQIHKY